MHEIQKGANTITRLHTLSSSLPLFLAMSLSLRPSLSDFLSPSLSLLPPLSQVRAISDLAELQREHMHKVQAFVREFFSLIST